MASIELRNISKCYAENQYGVCNLNLKILDGEFLVLLGPSGCGKSTTLRMIAGLENISEGTLLFDGENMNYVAPRHRNVAVVFQSYALYPHMTVAENMAFGLKMRKIPKQDIEQKILTSAQLLGLEKLLNRKPAALSGGQRQRVALGRAMVRNPGVFLLDEPLSNLDAQLRADMRGELKNLHHRLGKTMIYVTHDQVEAMTMADRVCIMNKGRLIQIGAPIEVYSNPSNTFVAKFLSSYPINLLSCDLHVNGRNLCLQLVGGPKINLCESLREDYRHYAGRRVTLGIRSEDFLVQQHQVHWLPLKFKVDSVEALGAEYIARGTIDKLSLTVRFDQYSIPKEGELITIYINPERLHIFDSDTGNVILRQ